MLSDKYYVERGDEESGFLEEEMAEESPSAPIIPRAAAVNFEIVGSAKRLPYQLTEDVKIEIKEDDTYEDELLKCGVLVFDITNDKSQIKKALCALHCRHSFSIM